MARLNMRDRRVEPWCTRFSSAGRGSACDRRGVCADGPCVVQGDGASRCAGAALLPMESSGAAADPSCRWRYPMSSRVAELQAEPREGQAAHVHEGARRGVVSAPATRSRARASRASARKVAPVPPSAACIAHLRPPARLQRLWHGDELLPPRVLLHEDDAPRAGVEGDLH